MVYTGGMRDTNNYFAEAGVTARQHLLKDFWIDQPREVLRIRRKESKMTEQALRFQVASILLAVELGYYELIAAREQVRVQEKALESATTVCGRDAPAGRSGRFAGAGCRAGRNPTANHPDGADSGSRGLYGPAKHLEDPSDGRFPEMGRYRPFPD